MEKEEIIFQVKINRESKSFELVKTSLNNFEQAAFQLYLESYIKSMRDLAVEEIKEDYELK